MELADSLKGETNSLAFLLKDRSLPTAAAMFTKIYLPIMHCADMSLGYKHIRILSVRLKKSIKRFLLQAIHMI